eukprot:gnl/MRDRNA2_/MRDRNA2_92447_c0_seq1.p1 gnl/MRDRNA2_/MRDRNA2_92447_c0~~gnl/MRDRNA2_/MRDRNA2_92447_c0_seq1.p1  ORF type:complete len:625 (+),score=128.13 gnl/MRDRNA2_/MRDRNA2_92447_c0_seq1:152-2026(+)
MTTSFLSRFGNPIPPSHYRPATAKGSWLAKDKESETNKVVAEPPQDPKEKWNRKGKYLCSSFEYATKRTGGSKNRPQSAPGSAAKKTPRPQSAWSEATTSANTIGRGTPDIPGRDTPDLPPDMYKEENFEAVAPVLNLLQSSTKAPTEFLTKEQKKEREKEMKWLLMQRGRDMSDVEYQRLVLDAMKPRERSKSRFESCLIPDRVRKHPAQVAHWSILASLAQDDENFQDKYKEDLEKKSLERLEQAVDNNDRLQAPGASHVVTQAWKHPVNKYACSLPMGKQHDKFTRLDKSFRKEMTAPIPGQKEQPKFALHTLRNWFHAIDTEKKGVLSRRQMLNTLWHHKDLCGIFSRAAGLEHDSWSQQQTNKRTQKTVACFDSLAKDMEAEFKDAGADDSDIESINEHEDDRQTKADELRAIARILRDVDKDGSGQVSWHELVEFFRRTGTLLEYETEKGKSQNEATRYWMDTSVVVASESVKHWRNSVKDPLVTKGHRTAPPGTLGSYGAPMVGRGEEQKSRDSERRSSWQRKEDAGSSRDARRSLTKSLTMSAKAPQDEEKLTVKPSFGKTLTEADRQAEAEGEIVDSMMFGQGFAGPNSAVYAESSSASNEEAKEAGTGFGDYWD